MPWRLEHYATYPDASQPAKCPNLQRCLSDLSQGTISAALAGLRARLSRAKDFAGKSGIKSFGNRFRDLLGSTVGSLKANTRTCRTVP
jgi:hypothetical protein